MYIVTVLTFGKKRTHSYLQSSKSSTKPSSQFHASICPKLSSSSHLVALVIEDLSQICLKE